MMQRPRFIFAPLVFLFSLFAATSGVLATSVEDLGEELALDPTIRVGRLENGLTYYIRSNPKPENRVSLRLVVNAGSLQEDHDQKGLAHLIEHMAFNGTERFEKSEVVDFLEKSGMRFGADLNAYTSFDETVYKLELPTEDPEVLETGFKIVEDWASALSFDEVEIDKERGVVVEEWRSQQGVSQRIRNKQYPALYYDSKYAKRLPIGSMFTIQGAPRHRIVDFYHDWYRPDLMALIVVGDFEDVGAMEKRIVEGFGRLENPEESREREIFDIPGHEETLFSIQSDPELTSSSVSIHYKGAVLGEGTVGEYRDLIVRQLYFGLLNNRLAERTQEAEPPYLGASSGQSIFGRTRSLLSYSVGLIDGNLERGLSAMLGEVARVRRDGFSIGELERQKVNYLRGMERSVQELENIPSNSFAAEYTRNFLYGEPVPGLQAELELTRRFLAEIELEDIDRFGASLPTGAANRVILYTAPENEEEELPQEEELLALIDEGLGQELDEYEDLVSGRELLDPLPESGQISEEIYHEDIQVHEWVLSNGVRVLIKPTDFKNDEILMTSYSPGGYSLVADDEFTAAVTAMLILNEGGIGEFNQIELEKMLAGKIAGVSAYIGDLYEGLGGTTSPKDLDTFFQLINLHILHPRLDMDSFSSIKSRIMSMVINRMKSPQAAFDDAISEAMYGDHPRHLPMSVDVLNTLDPELSLAIFEDRFADCGDFTFVFVGSIDLDRFRPFVAQYLASLPTGGRVEKGRFNGDYPAEGHTEVIVARGLENKAQVRVRFMGDAKWSPEENYAFVVAQEVLRLRLRENLREEKGGTYGVSVSGGLIREPRERFGAGFSFICEPDRARDLISAAIDEIDRLKVEGPSAEDLEKVRKMHVKSYEKGLKENGYWLKQLSSLSRQGRDLSEVLQKKALFESVTPEIIGKTFERYYSDENQMIAILYPEGFEEESD